MQYLNFSRTFLLACVLVPACGDNGGDSSTGSTTNTTPGMMTTDPTGTSTVDPTGTNTTDPTTEPTTTPTTEPTTTPTTDPTTDPTGDPTAGDGTFCQEQCAVDGDCTVMGFDAGLKCTDGRCAGSGCADDNACIQQSSGWNMDCMDQAGCPAGACIDVGGGVGKCAVVPSEFVMCGALLQQEVMYPPIEGGADIVVCANTDFKCTDGACTNPCESDAECVVAGLTQCDAGTGACRCADDAGCMAANPATPRCTESGSCGCATDDNCAATPNTPTCGPQGFCGCATDANCEAAGTGDRCFNGGCGCSDATACPAVTAYDGTMFVCESF